MRQIRRGRALAALLAFLLLAVLACARAADAHETALFGTREIFSPNLAPFTKWTRVLCRIAIERVQGCVDPGSCVAGRWRILVAELRALPLRERVIRANDALNRLPYVSSAINW